MSKEITIEIDGVKVNTDANASIIEAADKAGIHIPRFCYHKKLSIAANCRMCLVEVEKVPKALPACATPIMPGMKIRTKSKLAIAAQRAVMEFLLINHPLDCPVCDQGGECELQDVSMGYGAGFSQYTQAKRSVIKEDLGPLIDTGMTRCIHCTRCVRFGDEIAGLRELGATGRGEDMSIGTYVKHFIKSEVSGNIIDLCPVGALTSKPSSLRSRSWELQASKLISPHDCLGSHMEAHTRGHANHAAREVMRVVPRDCDSLNENWLSDRDRFSYQALHHADRLQQPMIKKNGQWQKTTWQQILPHIASCLEAIMQDNSRTEKVACLVSPQSTTEEMFLLQKVMRHLGVSSIDHRYRSIDFSDQDSWPQLPHTLATMSDVENADKIFIIGLNPRHDVPLLGLRIRAASLADNADAKVMLLNSVDYTLHFEATQKIITTIDKWQDILSQVLFLLIEKREHDLKLTGKPKQISPEAEKLAKQLSSEGKTILILGLDALHHPQAATIRQLASAISRLLSTPMMVLTDGANSTGAAITGCLPHRAAGGKNISKPGLDAKQMFAKPHHAYWLHGVEVEADCADPAAALAALDKAGLVICCNSFATEAMLQYADILLPMAPWTEVPGSYINMFGERQEFKAASIPHHQAKPAWKILRVLGNLLECPGCDAKNINDVAELMQEFLSLGDKNTEENISKAKASPWHSLCKADISLDNTSNYSDKLLRYAPWPIYQIDPIVRRADSLQQTYPIQNKVMLNQKTAENLQLKDGDKVKVEQAAMSLELFLKINNTLSDNMLQLDSGAGAGCGFGAAWSEINLRRADDV